MIASFRAIILITLCWMACFSNVSMAATVEMSGHERRLVLSSSIDFITDPSQTLDVYDVLENSQLQWTQGFHSHEGIWVDPGTYWLKFSLHNPTDQAQSYTLELEHPSIGLADLYEVSESQTPVALYQNVGLEERFKNRPIPHRNIVNALTLPANSTVTYIWHLRSTHLFQFRATLWNQSAFFERDQHIQILYGLFYGMLGILVLYNLFLFSSTKDRVFYYFIAYVATTGYLMATFEGHLYQYIASGYRWPKMPVVGLVYAINIAMFCKFAISFLELKRYAPNVRRFLNGLSLLGIACVAIVVITQHPSFIFLVVMVMLTLYSVVLANAFRIRLKGLISAGYVVLGIMLQFFALIIALTTAEGIIRVSTLTESLPAIGTVSMLTFFALALGDRINKLQRDNIIATNALFKAQHDRREAASALARAQQDLQEMEYQALHQRHQKTRTEFYSTISEQVLLPASDALANMQELQSLPHSKWQHHLLSAIEQNCESLIDLSVDYQRRVEADEEAPIRYQQIHIRDFIDHCIATYAAQVSAKALLLYSSVENDVPELLQGDVGKLRRIIMTYLGNAIRYTKKGTIELHVSITGRPSFNSTEIRIAVIDSGAGLTTAQKEQLWSDITSSNDPELASPGSRGLQTCKRLAALMDGEFGFDSEAGKGATFWFTARLMASEQKDRQRKVWPVEFHDSQALISPCPAGFGQALQQTFTGGQINAQLFDDSTEFVSAIKQSAADLDIVICYCNDDDSIVTEIAALLSSLYINPVLIILSVTGIGAQLRTQISDYSQAAIITQPFTSKRLADALLVAKASDFEQPKPLYPHQAGKKVLILGTDEGPGLVLKNQLHLLGAASDMVSSPSQVVQACQNDHYHLLVIDRKALDSQPMENLIHKVSELADAPLVAILEETDIVSADDASPLSLRQPVSLEALRSLLSNTAT